MVSTASQQGALLMYDMYPDWGPSKNDPDSPTSHDAVQAALELRDHRGPWPDDN